MGPFSSLVGWLQSFYAFNYLALLVVLIVLYYFFDYVFKKHSGRLERRGTTRQAISLVLSIIITVLCGIFAFAGVGTLVLIVAVILFIVAVLFLVGVTGGRLAGLKTPFSND